MQSEYLGLRLVQTTLASLRCPRCAHPRLLEGFLQTRLAPSGLRPTAAGATDALGVPAGPSPRQSAALARRLRTANFGVDHTSAHAQLRSHKSNFAATKPSVHRAQRSGADDSPARRRSTSATCARTLDHTRETRPSGHSKASRV